jgi:hypothetical protein
LTDSYAAAPSPSHRFVPARFPPIGLFDTVSTAADLAAVMELEGWTNDRLVADRINRLPRHEWVFGRPNASIVMAAFLHIPASGSRFNGGDLGAWYASAQPRTAIAEVGHHLRREAIARSVPEIRRTYRAYSATLAGAYLDICGQQASRPDVYAPDSYAASQVLGEHVRATSGDGILFDSVRHAGGVNIAAHRPTNVRDVTGADHYEIVVRAVATRIDARRVS